MNYYKLQLENKNYSLSPNEINEAWQSDSSYQQQILSPVSSEPSVALKAQAAYKRLRSDKKPYKLSRPPSALSDIPDVDLSKLNKQIFELKQQNRHLTAVNTNLKHSLNIQQETNNRLFVENAKCVSKLGEFKKKIEYLEQLKPAKANNN